MNIQCLRTLILSLPSCEPYLTSSFPKDPAFREKDKAIADLLNAPSGIRFVETYENAVSLMSRIGVVKAGTILTKVEAAVATIPFLKWPMLALSSEKGLNFGDKETLAFLEELKTSGILLQEEVDSLKALAAVPSSLAFEHLGEEITPEQVSIAMRGI